MLAYPGKTSVEKQVLMIHIYDNAVDMLIKVFLGISLDITWTLFISHFVVIVGLDIPTYKMSTIYDLGERVHVKMFSSLGIWVMVKIIEHCLLLSLGSISKSLIFSYLDSMLQRIFQL